MKTINLKSLVKVLRGLLDGSLKLAAVAVKGKKTKASATPAKKRGRKPLPATVKKQKQLAKKSEKIKVEKSSLPTPREVFVFLADKLEGAKITEIAAHFKVKRLIIKPMIAKLVAKKDLTQMDGKLFLQRRLRGLSGAKREKAPAITEKEILAYLAKHPDSTMSAMAKALSNGKYQKLIKVLNKLVKTEKVEKKGKAYRAG